MASSVSGASLGLLLADPVDLRPTLADGLPAEAAGRARRPARVPRGVDELRLEAQGKDPNDLPKQRWGVIAPPGRAGDEALEALAPLISLRADEQGAPVRIYRDAPLQAGYEAALRWKDEVWWAVPDAERPRYLLIVGEVDQISLDFQHVLANRAYVGRLHAQAAAGYAAYATKVVRWARSPSDCAEPEALFFAADDGTDATTQGRELLVRPCQELGRAHHLPVAELGDTRGVRTTGDFLRAAERTRPSVLLSVGHGLAAGRQRWRSADEQRALQGSLVVGGEPGPLPDRLLTADYVRSGTFFPGGLWFMIACFGAGTPQQSAFDPWLAALLDDDEYAARAARVREHLPQPGEPPFLAALPQAALANPDGPLAVIGHVDLAWTFSFVDPHHMNRGRPERIFGSVRAMVQGSRVGVALDALMSSYREVNEELLLSYQSEEEAHRHNRPLNVDLRRRASAFMLRNDLRGYLLLGDPAARLPLAGSAAQTLAAPGATASAADPVAMEAAVLAHLRDPAAGESIAGRHGISRAELERWVTAYCQAGRAALAQIGRPARAG